MPHWLGWMGTWEEWDEGSDLLYDFDFEDHVTLPCFPPSASWTVFGAGARARAMCQGVAGSCSEGLPLCVVVCVGQSGSNTATAALTCGTYGMIAARDLR